MDNSTPDSDRRKIRRVKTVAWTAMAVLFWGGVAVMFSLSKVNTTTIEVAGSGASYIAYGWAGSQSIPTPRRESARSVPARDTDLAKADALAKELSRRIAEHENLPHESLFGSIGLGALANDQRRNEAVMAKILDSLATEIGATKAAGAIRALQGNREKQTELEGAVKSRDLEIRKNAEVKLKEILQENKMFEDFVRQSFANEGVVLSEEQVRALCASPNAEDAASMISAFGALKVIAAKMEERLRWTPSQEQAQKYYGAHYALLLALDKIKAEAMTNIRDIYIPGAVKIGEDAKSIAVEAGNLLAGGGLSPDELQALKWNIISCRTTTERAETTQKKLEKNLDIISRAREKLAKSLATAKNCHSTAVLQKQVLWLEGTALQEFARIEALTIPPLAAVNFADPESPDVSPAARPLM